MRTSTNQGVLMKPEGSRKVVVLNGSRQLDQVINGEWMTLQVLPESGLPKGIYQLSEAQRPAVSSKQELYAGAVLQVDEHHVFQIHETGIIKHDRAAFSDLERTKGWRLAVGQHATLAYENGRAKWCALREAAR